MTEVTIDCGDQRQNLTIERTDFSGIVVKNLMNKTVKCLAQSVRRNEDSDFGYHYRPGVDINFNQIHYFKGEIGVKIYCFDKQGAE